MAAKGLQVKTAAIGVGGESQALKAPSEMEKRGKRASKAFQNRRVLYRGIWKAGRGWKDRETGHSRESTCCWKYSKAIQVRFQVQVARAIKQSTA